MGRLILVSGENDSGKSRFAEKIAVKCEGKRYYAATMIPETEENHKRIEKHKKQREGLGFTDRELPYVLSDALGGSDCVVLIEDVSNLLANNIFGKHKSADEVFEDIMKLTEKGAAVIAVTITGFEASGYDGETKMYVSELNRINSKLKNEAFAVINMTDGKPFFEKGEEDDIF